MNLINVWLANKKVIKLKVSYPDIAYRFLPIIEDTVEYNMVQLRNRRDHINNEFGDDVSDYIDYTVLVLNPKEYLSVNEIILFTIDDDFMLGRENEIFRMYFNLNLINEKPWITGLLEEMDMFSMRIKDEIEAMVGK